MNILETLKAQRYSFIVAIICIISMFFMHRCDIEERNSVLADEQKKHEAEVDELQQLISRAESERRAEAEKYQLTIKKIDEHYQATLAGIEMQKADEVEQILQDYGNDPAIVAQKISELTGYQIVTSEGGE